MFLSAGFPLVVSTSLTFVVMRRFVAGATKRILEGCLLHRPGGDTPGTPRGGVRGHHDGCSRQGLPTTLTGRWWQVGASRGLRVAEHPWALFVVLQRGDRRAAIGSVHRVRGSGVGVTTLAGESGGRERRAVVGYQGQWSNDRSGAESAGRTDGSMLFRPRCPVRWYTRFVHSYSRVSRDQIVKINDYIRIWTTL